MQEHGAPPPELLKAAGLGEGALGMPGTDQCCIM